MRKRTEADLAAAVAVMGIAVVSACGGKGYLDGGSEAAPDPYQIIDAGLPPLLAPGAIDLHGARLSDMRVWPVPGGGSVAQFVHSTGDTISRVLVCADGSIKTFSGGLAMAGSAAPLGSDKLVMISSIMPTIIVAGCDMKEAASIKDLVTVAYPVAGASVGSDRFVVAGTAPGKLVASTVQLSASGELQVLQTIDIVPTNAKVQPVFVREYEEGKLELLYADTDTNVLSYARNDGSAPVSLQGVSWPHFSSVQDYFSWYREVVRVEPSGALLLAGGEDGVLLQTENTLWRWQPGTAAATQVAKSPSPPAGFDPWQAPYGWGASIAVRNVPNPQDPGLDMPMEFLARTVLADNTYATASFPRTPCVKDEDCRLYGESTLVGVAGWGASKVAFYELYSWAMAKPSDAGNQNIILSYAVPMK